MDNLEGFFKGPDEAPEAAAETPPPEATETPEVAEQPEAPAKVRDEKGRFAPKGETESASPAPEPPLDHAALLGERRRRQELEQRLAELEARYAQPVAQPQVPQQQEGPPDRWEDPEGYDRYMIEQVKAEARAEAMQVFQYQRIEQSAAAARQALPDYDDKIAEFGKMVQTNPALLEQLHKAPNPAEYAYNTAKTALEIAQYGGIDGLIQARVAEALKTQAPAVETATPPIPETLADAQSARGSSAAWSPRPLEEFLGPRKR